MVHGDGGARRCGGGEDPVRIDHSSVGQPRRPELGGGPVTDGGQGGERGQEAGLGG